MFKAPLCPSVQFLVFPAAPPPPEWGSRVWDAPPSVVLTEACKGNLASLTSFWGAVSCGV